MQMQLKSLNLPELAEITKSVILDKAEQIVSIVVSENASAIEMDVRLKAMEEVIDIARKKIKPMVLSEMGANKSIDVAGTKISQMAGRVLYDYESDSAYKTIKEKLDKRKALLDMAIKATQSGVSCFDEESGEVVISPIVKSTSEDTIKYEFKK